MARIRSSSSSSSSSLLTLRIRRTNRPPMVKISNNSSSLHIPRITASSNSNSNSRTTPPSPHPTTRTPMALLHPHNPHHMAGRARNKRPTLPKVACSSNSRQHMAEARPRQTSNTPVLQAATTREEEVAARLMDRRHLLRPRGSSRVGTMEEEGWAARHHL